MKYTITTKKKRVKLGKSEDEGFEATLNGNVTTAHSEWLAIRKVINMQFNLTNNETSDTV